MTPEERRKLNELHAFMLGLGRQDKIPLNVEKAFRYRLARYFEINLPDGFEDAPLALITAPTGGATVDAEARAAVNTVITRLENLGLVLPN